MSQIVHQVFSHSRKEQKKQRIENQKKYKLDRQAKLERTRYKSVADDIELENIFRQFGLSIIKSPNRRDVFKSVPKVMEGKRPEYLTSKALDFLVQEFDAEVVTDNLGRTILQFPKEKPKGESMNLFSEVAEKSGHKRKMVKEVYEAILSRIRVNLKNERYIRLPDLCRIRVSYRPAKEKRRGINPFNGKKMWFKARPASNKLRFSPLKAMKDYVADKVEVVEPKKKRKKKK